MQSETWKCSISYLTKEKLMGVKFGIEAVVVDVPVDDLF